MDDTDKVRALLADSGVADLVLKLIEKVQSDKETRAAPLQPTDLLTSEGVRRRLGDRSKMSFWRLCQENDFPPPDFVIRRRSFWKVSTVDRWLARFATAPAA